MNTKIPIYPHTNGSGPARREEGKTILIVEDYHSIRELMALHLGSLGYRTLTASDGKEAQEVVLKHGIKNIDLLVTDLNMPAMRGDELAEWFAQKKPSTDVIVMFSSLDRVKPHRSISYLQKPFSLSALKYLISKLLDKPSRGPSRYAETDSASP